MIDQLRRRLGRAGAPREDAGTVTPASKDVPVPRYLREIQAPEAPPGWTIAPPDFVGVGAQRAGTSWWYRFALDAHPGIARADGQPKEVHFFDRFWTEPVPDGLADSYAQQFPRPEGTLAGEWTPRYMHDPWTPPLLREAAPDAKILVMLRDPIDRYLSGIAREARLAKRDGRALAMAFVSDQISRSAYLKPLELLFSHFERDRVLVLQYERCSADPVGEMERTCGFLGIDPPAEHPEALTSRRRGAAEKPEIPSGLERGLDEWLREDAHEVTRLCPELDGSLWPTLGGAR